MTLETTIKPSQLKAAMRAAIQAKEPLLIVGEPGVGKTAITHQIAEELNQDMITLFPAISDPTLFTGQPYYDSDTKEATFLPYGLMKQLIKTDKETVCLVDDIGQSDPSTMKAFLHFIHARQVGHYKLSDKITIIACTNDQSHNAGVIGMIEPLKSRFLSILSLQVDVEDWIMWAIQNNIRPEVVGLVRLRGKQVLSNFQPTMALSNTPSPRGNEKVSNILNMSIKDRELEFAMIQGACGHGYAVEMAGFRKLFETLVDPQHILKHPTDVQIPLDNPSVLFAYCSALSRLAEPETMEPIVTFAKRLPIEFQIKLLQYDCKSANPENHATGAYTRWAIDNQNNMKAA